MPRVRSISPIAESADAQIDAAVMRLVDLFARQAARELAADASFSMETPDAAEPEQEV